MFLLPELSEELALQNNKDPELENEIEFTEDAEDNVVTFKLKYLGSTVVEKVTGDSISVEAVKNIVKVAKASRKKLQRVNLTISLKGISVTDLQGNDILKISIYRISNCSTDASHRQVFSFISTDPNETMECHAFLCSKRKVAETVTLAVAHAFSTAYEAWRILPSTKEFEQSALEKENSNFKNTTLKTEIFGLEKSKSSLEKPKSALEKSKSAFEKPNSFSEKPKSSFEKHDFSSESLNLNNDKFSFEKLHLDKHTLDKENLKNAGITETPKIIQTTPLLDVDEKLIDFDDEPNYKVNVISCNFQQSCDNNSSSKWVSFDDDFEQSNLRWTSNTGNLIMA